MTLIDTVGLIRGSGPGAVVVQRLSGPSAGGAEAVASWSRGHGDRTATFGAPGIATRNKDATTSKGKIS